MSEINPETNSGPAGISEPVMERKVTEGEEVSIAVAEMLASLNSVQPYETPFQLHDYIDADALEKLLESSHSNLTVSFTVDNYRVTVENDGTVFCQPVRTP